MNDRSLCSAFPIVCTAGSAWEVHATPLKSSIASWPWAVITRPVASPSLAASSRNDDCEWRFNDAATGFWAGYNPLRWSGKISLARAISDLEKVSRHKDRPIILKIPSGMFSWEERFESCQDAIIRLRAGRHR